MKKYNPHKSTRYKNLSTVINLDDKPFPELYKKRSECCGCSACYAICLKKAITMEPDEEGFLYPVVDVKLCVRCYTCLNVCVLKG